MFDSRHRSAAAPQSPPLVPFSFPPHPAQPVPSGSFASSAPSCPPSPPLVALSLFNFSSDPSPHASSSMSGTAASPTLPSRPVAHPLQSTSKLRLEMTPLPTFHLPLADVEMSPPWSNQDLAPLAKPRKNSVVALPVAPPTPPLTPSEELPPFDWRPQTRGRSTEVNPLSKVCALSYRLPIYERHAADIRAHRPSASSFPLEFTGYFLHQTHPFLV